MDGIDDENTFLLDDELHSDTDTDISSNYLDYSSDDSCSELSSDEDLSSARIFTKVDVKNPPVPCPRFKFSGIWPSEEVLTYYCMKNKELFGGNSVCELGGGMACLSGLAIAATAGAKEVFVTDGNMRYVENVKCIIEQNRQYFGATHVVSRLYYDDGRHALAETIWKILKVDGVAVILAPTRGKTFQYFVDIVEKDFMVERLMAYDTHVWELNCCLKEAKSCVYDEDLHYPQMLILRKF
ncbi:Calmodulin-lysine N-methyltransferase [Araneus ventricosus]|uniref:Calmodulin-lysine N-methyltransferase n=1 Tax=Araneus ventricosus TaxID=182803 RepID=A0A4Y2RTS0_ARAVE|nr:Calmodulin-lysine N-methyltransferase [Araneus ventricosus]